MFSLIETNSIILRDNLSEYMCLFKSSILEECSEQWRYNRNLNNDKIQSICHNIKDKYILDTVLHFFYVNDNENEKLICFDGNHRREALILLYKTQNIDINVCCYIYKCKNINEIDKEIVDKFRIINQMTPIPDIYNDIINNLDNNKLLIEKKQILENVFEIYKKKYKAFYSVNSKCRKPNFNETTFKDFCHNLEFDSKDDLIKQLNEININKQKQIYNTLLSNMKIAKCESYKFYIFS